MKHMSYRKRTMLAGYAFAAPGMIFALLYMGYPMVRSFYLSFTRYNFAFDPKPTFAGLQNYIDMAKDPTAILWMLCATRQCFPWHFFHL